ncbi:MAG: hypothetical protein WBQ24_10610 [Xanthobacteraceae bacterium]|jgi:hypothetical protein
MSIALTTIAAGIVIASSNIPGRFYQVRGFIAGSSIEIWRGHFTADFLMMLIEAAETA